MFGRSSLFKKALTACEKLQARHPQAMVLASIIAQLKYLIDLDAGRTKDRSRLSQIALGVQAAREIEPLDLKTAELLYEVADAARKM